MSVPHVPTPTPVELRSLGTEQLHTLMLESANALINFYAEQMPGAPADRQRSLTRTIRHVRGDLADVIASDRTSVARYFHCFQIQLADEELTRTATVAVLPKRPRTDSSAAVLQQHHPGSAGQELWY